MKTFASDLEYTRRSAEIEQLRLSCRDVLPMRIIVSALVLGIIAASTTLYLNGLDRAANLLQ